MKLQLPVFPDRNDPRPLVMYHGNQCPDGFAAALAAWLYFDGHAEFLALDHGDVQSPHDLPEVAGRAIYILDFSFPRDILGHIDSRAAKLVLLDHHQSAAETLTGFACRSGVVHFDMKSSGARLAWAFFHPDQTPPDLVRYVEDRDLWVWQYPESASYLAALDMEPFEFERWHAICRFDAAEQAAFMVRGQAMDAKFNQLAQQLARHPQALRLNGIDGLMVNAPGFFHSVLGDLLCRQCDTFALMWSVDHKGQVKCGLRSGSGFNCIPLAQSMGGGGHAQASAFRMPYQRLAELLGGTLDA